MMTALYDRMPILLQNAIVSYYGGRLHRMRYGGVHGSQLEEVLLCEKMSADEMRAYQVVKLKALLTEAAKNLPYYEDQADRLLDLASSMRDPCEITALPLLEKEIVNKDPTAFHSLRPRGKRLYGNTSGTTGRPLRTMKVPASYQRNWAFLARLKEIHGIRMGMRRASIGYRAVVPYRQRKPPFWRWDRSENNLYFSLFHLSEENFPSYVERLNAWKPEEVVGYPSSLTLLADRMIERGSTLDSVRAVIVATETLHTWQRDRIELAFGARVVNYYGLAENVAWIYECPEGRMHVRPDYGYTELLPIEGTTPESGGKADVREIVSTGFLNLAMPLLRYRTRDQVVVTEDDETRCSCGVPFPTVTDVIGRADDNLITPDGRVQVRLTGIFKGLSGVRESQIEQVAIDRLLVRIVPNETYKPEIGLEVIRRLREIFGAEMKVEIDLVDALQKTKAGKIRYQINSLPKEQRAVLRSRDDEAERAV